MRLPHFQDIFRSPGTLIPAIALFFGLATIPAGIWALIDVREDRALQDVTDQYARNIAIQVQSTVNTRLGLMRALAARIEEDPRYGEPEFERTARLYLREFPGISALTWVDQDFIVRWVYPHNPGTASLVGMDARKGPSGPYAYKATLTGQPTATPPLKLRIADSGFLLVFPVFRNGTKVGSLGGVVVNSDLMQIALGDEPVGHFQIAVSDGAINLFNRYPDNEHTPFASSRSVTVLDRTWRVEANPRDEYVAALKTPTKTLLLVLGLLLSAGMAVMYGFARGGAKRAEEHRRRLFDAIEALPAGFLLYDSNHRLVLWNTHLKVLYPEAAPLLRPGMRYSEAVRLIAERQLAGTPEEIAARTEGWASSFSQSGGSDEYTLKDGRTLRSIDWRTEDGSTVCLRFDITDAKQREEQLRRAQSRLFDAIEALPAAFFLWDTEERLVLWNSHATTVYAHMSDQLRQGMRYEEFAYLVTSGFARTDAEQLERFERRVATFRRAPSTTEIATNDGRTLQCVDWRTVDGSTVSIRFDITESKRRERELGQSRRMDALGKLTGGIAHDFNNLLTVILGNADLMTLDGVKPRDVAASAELVRTAAVRGAELTSRLLVYSRQQNLRPEPIDVNRLVRNMGEILRRVLGEHIAIETHSLSDKLMAVADASQLENALLNLSVNARDAMPNGGRLTLETSIVRLDSASPVIEPDRVHPGGYVMVSVTDTGEGMAPETMEHAFEPFFTTKEPGKGTGLGLSMVYGFVTQSGGHVQLTSARGSGTTIKLYLPCAEGCEEGVPLDPPRKAVLPEGTEAILVVEDDALVRRTAVAQLRGLGYRVLEAEHGAAALEMLRGDSSVDLLFTDEVMPGGMMGRQLAVVARQLRQGLRVLVTSGYTNSSPVTDAQDPEAPILPKPYTREILAHTIRATLDRAR